MKYVLGIDSGGTKYLVKAAALNGTVLAAYTGQPAAHYRIGTERAFVRIQDSINQCLNIFQADSRDCAAITVGTTGMDTPDDLAVLENIYRRLPGFDCPLQIVNDAVVAHHAATGGVGVVVIVGTGSIAYGRNIHGQTWRVGGWPPCIGGDEGSGTWLLCRALKHMSHVLDGRSEPTALSLRLQEALNLHTQKQLIEICQQIENATFSNPGVGLWINQLAEGGDSLCRDLLTAAGREAAGLAKAVISRLSFPDSMVVGVWGSAIVKSPIQFEAFRQEVQVAYPHAHIVIAHQDAADGAIAMALEQLKS